MWCYKWTDWIQWDGSLGGVKYYGANKMNCEKNQCHNHGVGCCADDDVARCY